MLRRYKILDYDRKDYFHFMKVEVETQFLFFNRKKIWHLCSITTLDLWSEVGTNRDCLYFPGMAKTLADFLYNREQKKESDL